MSEPKRFQYIAAVDMKELVENLNRRAEEYWFTVVYMANGVAVIDTALHPVAVVGEDEFSELQIQPETPSPSFA
jgi:hypothetical protein